MKALKQGKYPYSKIIIYYVLITGLVNAFALASISVLMFKNETLVEVPFIFLVFSFFITTSPAFIFLSIWFCYKKYVFHQINDIYSLMKKSLFSFMVYLFFNLMIVWEKFVYLKANIIFIGISIVLFVLLSTLTLYQILPKTGKYHHQKQHRAKIKYRNKIRHALSPNQDTIPEENLVSKSILKEKEVQSFNFSDFFHGSKNKFLNPTTMKNGKYPYIRVILEFLLFGGAIGGIVVSIISVVLLPVIILAIIGGIILGTIPSLLTGIFLAYKRVCLANKYDYFYIFLVGYIATFIHRLIPEDIFVGTILEYVFMGGLKMKDFLENVFAIILANMIYSLIGGVTAVILGHHILPRSKDIQ